MKTEMQYKSYGTQYTLEFKKCTYQNNGSLAIQVMCREEGDDFLEPFCRLTVNLAVPPVRKNCAYIDTNNVPQDLIQMLLDEGVMTFTGVDQMSGWCIYPEAEFNAEWLNEL